MRIGICSWSFSGTARGSRSVQDVSAAAAEWGFAYFEGAFGSRGELAPGRQVARLPGAPMPSLATLELHRFHLTDLHAKRRERALDVVAAMIDCASAWNAGSVSFSPGAAAAVPGGLDEAVERACALLEPVVQRARGLDIAVALENLPFHCLGSRRGMRRALQRLPDARVCLDLGNASVDGPVSAWIDEFGDRIEKVHVSDARLDGGFALVLPPTGQVPWAEIRPRLRELDCPLFVEAPLPAGEHEAGFLDRIRKASEELMAA